MSQAAFAERVLGPMWGKSRDYEAALSAARSSKPNYERVIRLLNKAIAKGDARAALALARWYRDGLHVKKSLRKALTFLRLAAQSDLPEALFDLANCHETGFGVRANPSKALQLYTRASLSGHAKSMFEVGRCLYHGIGTPKDRRLAWIWLDAAKKRGVTGSTAAI